MEFPRCPSCQQGQMLPMSMMNVTFGYWVCNAPACTYVVSGAAHSVKYFKGNAVVEPKQRGEKEWTEFEF